jgi:hypothetical protein
MIVLHVSGLWFMVLSKTRNLCARIPKAFSNTRLVLPVDDVPVPYYIVGDNAFGISKRLMNPFVIRNMEHHDSPEPAV